MKNIVLQAGHQNIQYNIDPNLRGSTGAPQEMQKNLNITSRTAELLRARGITVKQTDANANNDDTIKSKDWDLFLAVHCDADTASNGGYTDWPDPNTDAATLESQRIANKISDKFYPETGLVFRPERRQKSNNIKYYYMWNYLSASTPCVLIEMGESIDAHDSVILNDTEKCAIALARGICNAFGIPYDITQPNSVPNGSVVLDQKTYQDLLSKIDSNNNAIAVLKSQYETALALKDNELLSKLQAEREKLKTRIIDIIKTL